MSCTLEHTNTLSFDERFRLVPFNLDVSNLDASFCQVRLAWIRPRLREDVKLREDAVGRDVVTRFVIDYLFTIDVVNDSILASRSSHFEFNPSVRVIREGLTRDTRVDTAPRNVSANLTTRVLLVQPGRERGVGSPR